MVGSYRVILNFIGNYFSADGPRTAVTVITPTGVWIDSSNTVYYSDRGNALIRRINPTTDLVTTVVGTGVVGFNGDGLAGTRTQITAPLGLYVDTSGNIYFTQANGIVRKLTAVTNIVKIFAGNLQTTVAVDGVPPTSSGLNSPRAVWIESTGRVFIADTGNYRIRLVNTTAIISTYAGNGANSYGGDTGTATSAQIGQITDLQGDSNGNLFLLDSSFKNIRKISSNGIITTLCGISGSFPSPTGFWLVTSDTSFYVTDNVAQNVLKVSNGCATTLVTGGTKGVTSDNVDALTAYLNFPFDVSLDGNNNLFLTQYGNSMVNKIDLTVNKIYVTTAIPPLSSYYGDGLTPTSKSDGSPVTSSDPCGLWGDTSGRLYITDVVTRVIFQLQPGSASGTVIAGTFYSTSLCTSETSATNAYLYFPTGIWVSTLGFVYFADAGCHIIRKITLSASKIDTIAGSSTSTLPYQVTTMAATSAILSVAGPIGIVGDTLGNLYFADSNNTIVRRLKPVSSDRYNITTYAGVYRMIGSTGSATAGDPTTVKIGNPVYLYLDTNNNLYVTDSTNFNAATLNAYTQCFYVSGNVLSCSSTDITLPSNMWSHVIMIKRVKTVALYLNNVLTVTLTLPNDYVISNGEKPLIIGAVNGLNTIPASGVTAFYRGGIDDIIAPTTFTPVPTTTPTTTPSSFPTTQPSSSPSFTPSTEPSSRPSVQPTTTPHSTPSSSPSVCPTCQPSTQPSSNPSASPSLEPTQSPPMIPSCQPSTKPSSRPSRTPTTQPSRRPTNIPATSTAPSFQSSSEYPSSLRPSPNPTTPPSHPPSVDSSPFPTIVPTPTPSMNPTFHPTFSPTRRPTTSVTSQPSISSKPTFNTQPFLIPSYSKLRFQSFLFLFGQSSSTSNYYPDLTIQANDTLSSQASYIIFGERGRRRESLDLLIIPNDRQSSFVKWETSTTTVSPMTSWPVIPTHRCVSYFSRRVR
eukprot:gene6849-7384_t